MKSTVMEGSIPFR